jgi:ribosomal protein S18 acetylase RimI-like enzyme
MKTTLSPMPPERLPKWLTGIMNAYVEERVKAGESLPAARANAERSLLEFFPGGNPAPHHLVFDLMVAGSPVGYLWIGPSTGERRAWWVYDIEVDESLRGQGLGRQAMLLAEEEARWRGATSLGLNVFGHNGPARRLYERLGYETTSLQMKKDLTG